MIIQLNGEAFELGETRTLSQLVKQLELEGKRFAIEVNEDIISRSEHDTHLLQDDDKVEVVVAIGGG